jgi:hypothetical protein
MNLRFVAMNLDASSDLNPNCAIKLLNLPQGLNESVIRLD